MKVLKAYGKFVYINNEKVNVYDVEHSFYFDNKKSYGYGIDNQLVIIEDESELKFVDGCGVKDFEEVEMHYSLFKNLQKLPASGYIKSRDYNPETKTIKVSKITY